LARGCPAALVSAVIVSLVLLDAPSVIAYMQTSFDEAAASLPAEVRDVKSAGRWRTTNAAGVYRVIVMRAGYDHVVDRLYIQWVRNGSADGPPLVVATVSVSGVNDAGPFTFSHTLQPEATNRLRITVTATHAYTANRRQFVFIAAAPNVYAERPSPPAMSPGGR
jgi:hypothetical protein